MFLDNKFWISLTKNQIIDHNLYKNKEISADTKKILEKDSQIGKIIEKAIKYIFIRPRSEKEITDYINKKNKIEKEELESIINTLKNKKYISDLNFSNWYIQNRKEFGFHGNNKIKAELIKKGVSLSVIHESLKKYKDSDLEIEKIKKYIEKISKGVKAKDNYEFNRKLIKRLMSRGYEYDKIKKAMN